MLTVLRSSIDAREEKRRRVNTALKIELPKPRVLLIDDEVLLRRAYARILGDSYDVSMESAAEPALQRLVRYAWLLDSFGDLGNRQQVEDAYAAFARAVADVSSAFGGAQ